jgi:hypothetical protein
MLTGACTLQSGWHYLLHSDRWQFHSALLYPML